MDIQNVQDSPVQHKFHHDSRPYAVASEESAKKARTKLQTRFEQGKMALGSALKMIEETIPEDMLVPNDKLSIDYSEGRLCVGYKKASVWNWLDIHSHAYGQLLERADIPKKYGDRLLAENPMLLATNLRTRYHVDKKGTNYLSRAVNGQLRGWLSDSFARFDVKPMVEAFLETCLDYKAVPVEARNTDTRFYLKMMVPVVFEPVPNEVLAFGVQFRSSDFGDGAYEVRGFLSRVWCTNDAMTEDCLWKAHLGPKLTIDNFSQITLEKQAAMLASATRDTVKGILKPQNIERRLEIIKIADEKQIPISKTLENLRKNGAITKAESDRVTEALTSTDIEALPPVSKIPKKDHTSLYRFSNAFSWLAKEESTDQHRAMDLETLAGKVMGLQESKKVKNEA